MGVSYSNVATQHIMLKGAFTSVQKLYIGLMPESGIHMDWVLCQYSLLAFQGRHIVFLLVVSSTSP